LAGRPSAGPWSGKRKQSVDRVIGVEAEGLGSQELSHLNGLGLDRSRTHAIDPGLD
jgi:hypothetical protein